LIVDKWITEARTFANLSTKREHISKEESASQTLSHEVTIITGAVEAKQQSDIMTVGHPTCFCPD